MFDPVVAGHRSVLVGLRVGAQIADSPLHGVNVGRTQLPLAWTRSPVPPVAGVSAPNVMESRRQRQDLGPVDRLHRVPRGAGMDAVADEVGPARGGAVGAHLQDRR